MYALEWRTFGVLHWQSQKQLTCGKPTTCFPVLYVVDPERTGLSVLLIDAPVPGDSHLSSTKAMRISIDCYSKLWQPDQRALYCKRWAPTANTPLISALFRTEL